MNSNGYIYDGSFEGLLTCIYEAYYRHENPPFILHDKKYMQSIKGTLFSTIETPVNIKTDLMKYNKVYNAVNNKISSDALETIYHVFLSELPDFEIMILNYIKLGFKIGFDINKHLHDNRVLSMIKTERKVILEAHRMLGFIRFEKNFDYFYAAYEPDYNITSLISSHFAQRLSDQNFIIHDIKREIASIYNKHNWFITSLTRDNIPILSFNNQGSKYENLWKSYFVSTSISERENLKNQKRQMPRRYWNHLPEIE